MSFFDRHFAHWPPGVAKSLTVPRTSLYFNLEVSARRYPDKPAVVYYGNTLSYAALEREATALAGYLQLRCGVQRGDRVLLYAQNCPQFIVGYYAILRADAVVVPVNPMNKSGELAHYIQDSDARVAIAAQEIFGEIDPHLGKPGGEGLAHCVLVAYSDYLGDPTNLKVPDVVRAPALDPGRSGVTSWRECISSREKPNEYRAGPGDLAVLPYTSGTTGLPKGCMLTHANLLANTAGACAWSPTSSEAVALGVLPMFHLTGMQSNMNIPIQLGGTAVLMTRWDRDTAAELIQRHRVTGVTTMIVDFLANPDLGRYDLSSLMRIGGGGAAMPEAVASRIEQQLGMPYLEGYGMTETAAPTHANPAHRSKRQCAGIPFFDTDSRVIDPSTLQELGPNEVGEIIVHGPQVFRGYWKQDKATAEAFIEFDGKRFLRTGDLGYHDDEGYFFITDRLKRMINCSGYKVWPAEVEAMLYAHPDIEEACVISSTDAHRGETVKAMVVLKAAARGKTEAAAIIAWARENMAAFKAPRLVEFVDALPRTATGKVFWRRLQEEENRRST